MEMKTFAKNNDRDFTRTLSKTKVSGFTLVETLVAISIFSVSILSLMSVLANGIANTSYAKEKMIATYLAQEGIEYMRNLRDTHMLYDDSSGNSNGWQKFNDQLTGPLGIPSCNATNDSSHSCYFDDQSVDYTNPTKPIENITITPCGTACPELLYKSSTGRYNYDSSGTPSGYTRKIQMTHIPGSDETKIFSTVFWTQGSGSHSVTLSETLFNWIE